MKATAPAIPNPYPFVLDGISQFMKLEVQLSTPWLSYVDKIILKDEENLSQHPRTQVLGLGLAILPAWGPKIPSMQGIFLPLLPPNLC